MGAPDGPDAAVPEGSVDVEASAYLQALVRRDAATPRQQTYQAVRELMRRSPATASHLSAFELKVFSQNGEDGIIAEITRRLGIDTGYFVEFGIETAAEGNCVFLANVLGWRGLFIEGEPAMFAELSAKYRFNPNVTTANAIVSPENIDEVFRAQRVPDDFDILAIDVDGNDYWIWQGVRTCHPKVVVIEYNAGLDPSKALVQPYSHKGWDGTEYFGASLGAMCSLAAGKGYRLVYTELTGVNAFFVRSDLAADFPSADLLPPRFPNYYFGGRGHPRDPLNRQYLDLAGGH
jgi:hypothetical protein